MGSTGIHSLLTPASPKQQMNIKSQHNFSFALDGSGKHCLLCPSCVDAGPMRMEINWSSLCVSVSHSNCIRLEDIVDVLYADVSTARCFESSQVEVHPVGYRKRTGSGMRTVSFSWKCHPTSVAIQFGSSINLLYKAMSKRRPLRCGEVWMWFCLWVCEFLLGIHSESDDEPLSTSGEGGSTYG